MSYLIKNKLIVWLAVLLLAANIVTIILFMLGRLWRGGPPEQTADFLTRELEFDKNQRNSYILLVKDHQQRATALRLQIKIAKDRFFALLQQSGITDSEKQLAAAAVSRVTEQLDLLTFDHFQKVRNICTPAQQKKFDSTIKDVIGMMARPGRDSPHRPNGPPSRR